MQSLPGPPRRAALLHAILSLLALVASLHGTAAGDRVAGSLRLGGTLLWLPFGYAFVRPGPPVHPYGVVGGVVSCSDIVHTMLRASAGVRATLWRGAGPDAGPWRDYVRALSFAATLSAGAGSPAFGPAAWDGELVATAYQIFFAVASAVGVAKLIAAWLAEAGARAAPAAACEIAIAGAECCTEVCP